MRFRDAAFFCVSETPNLDGVKSQTALSSS